MTRLSPKTSKSDSSTVVEKGSKTFSKVKYKEDYVMNMLALPQKYICGY